MREISESELSKILNELNRLCDTGDVEEESVDLSSANLSDADLSGANLTQANLSDADLSGADLSRAYLVPANLSGANLRGANLRETDMHCANLDGADLRGANLCGCNLEWSRLKDANLRDANLRGAYLSGAYLNNANLREANMNCTDLGCADLPAADLSGADLSGADLNAADLNGADLSGADLSGASLRGANLNEADLSGADLSGAYLRKANLINVLGLTIEQISKVKTLYEASLSFERIKQVRKKYPHLLERLWLKVEPLRSSYKTLSVSEVQSMPKIYIREKYDYGFYGYSKINHTYSIPFEDDMEDKYYNQKMVVVAYATGLIWHRGGSDNPMYGDYVKEWIQKLNESGYAGYRDWRMPTLEEAASLLESSKNNEDLYIDPAFGKRASLIWTGDECVDGAGSEVAWTVNFYFGRVGRSIIGSCRNYVRPVRSVE
jgi:uncharacterized protein YjbI with pentapeptide repeats